MKSGCFRMFDEPIRFSMLFRSTLRMISTLRRPRSIIYQGTLFTVCVICKALISLRLQTPGTPPPCALHLLRCRFNDDFVPNLFSQPPMQRISRSESRKRMTWEADSLDCALR
ncbi:uncharacterized protein LACBIDRAFT_328676 [Laccaria bicolor S238N-H82]|uniref:Predicted protein n=1 Tax=Laccaria bicolor (strain S238N-H82 / ATCC MYA-4686) TaxID=486041 RepID=B0DFM9_LACBS|nr:uncharacterized protein LACBIDRAFT_328676 [Laccaria bicolor S238N-H82]EDR06372.1 predicted protein [Laccaria bicolor S238N-H82]|eukprot:XP_001882744.1 predicted protein [Laccaria bicolor S238N-H82]